MVHSTIRKFFPNFRGFGLKKFMKGKIKIPGIFRYSVMRLPQGNGKLMAQSIMAQSIMAQPVLKAAKSSQRWRGKVALMVLSAVFSAMVSGGCATRIVPHSEPTLMIAEAPNTPLYLKLINELYNGDLLMVHGTISGAVKWNRDDVRVRLRLYRDGELLTAVERSLGGTEGQNVEGKDDEGTGGLRRGLVPPGVEVPFRLEVSTVTTHATGFTDYQLELVWGEGSAEIRSPEPQSGIVSPTVSAHPADSDYALGGGSGASRELPLAGEALSITGLTSKTITDGCSAAICGLFLRGELVNQSGRIVKDVALVVGYRRKELKSLTDPVIPLKEELSLPDVNLGPGEVQPFEINFEEVGSLFEEILRDNLEPFAEVKRG